MRCSIYVSGPQIILHEAYSLSYVGLDFRGAFVIIMGEFSDEYVYTAYSIDTNTHRRKNVVSTSTRNNDIKTLCFTECF